MKKKALPNQDNIITLFSKELGKVSVFGKGIKKITSRRLPHIQTANLINTILYRKDERFYLQETMLISGFSQLKKDQRKLEFLYKLLFVVERILPDNQPEKDIYNLTLDFLAKLSKDNISGNDLLNQKFNKLLITLGYSKEEKSDDDLKFAIEEIIHEKFPELHL